MPTDPKHKHIQMGIEAWVFQETYRAGCTNIEGYVTYLKEKIEKLEMALSIHNTDPISAGKEEIPLEPKEEKVMP